MPRPDPPAPASCTSGAITKSVAYDALGNITAKSDVGRLWLSLAGQCPAACGLVHHGHGSTASSIRAIATTPDGNLTSGAGRTVAYTPFNRTASIVQGAAADCLAYDSDHARIRMERRAAACAGTLGSATYYLNDPVSGAMSEKMVAGSTVHLDRLPDGRRAGSSPSAPPLRAARRPPGGGFAWGAGTWSATASTWTYFTLDRLGLHRGS